eukprot:m.78343 g.78343  ORF g.78343 m.78343 type:complete len:201 (-) comp16226_c0_seq1:1318-1920(-)
MGSDLIPPNKMPILRPLPIETKKFTSQFLRMKAWFTTRRRWEVVEDWHYEITSGTNKGLTVVIPKGFVFNGVSSPRVFWWLFAPTGIMLIPSVVHDFGYTYDYVWGYSTVKSIQGQQTCSKMFNGSVRNDDGSNVDKRRLWDELFFDMGDSLNGVWVANHVSYRVLRLFGGWAWRAGRKRDSPELLPTSCGRVITNRAYV